MWVHRFHKECFFKPHTVVRQKYEFTGCSLYAGGGGASGCEFQPGGPHQQVTEDANGVKKDPNQGDITRHQCFVYGLGVLFWI